VQPLLLHLSSPSPWPHGARTQVLAGVFTFASAHPGTQYLVLVLLTVGYLALHLRLAPMQDSRAQGLQSALLSCLVGVALSGAPFAIALEDATPSPTGLPNTQTDAAARQLQVREVGPGVG
jgi:hypothetical protein